MSRWQKIKTRALYALNKLIWLLLIGFATNVVFVLLFMKVEHHSFDDSMWWGWVTGFTVGYGDIAPVTHMGRLIAVCAMGTDYILLGCFSAQIVVMVLINKDVFSHAEQELLKIRAEEHSRALHAIHTLLAGGGNLNDLPGPLTIQPFYTNAEILAEIAERDAS
jgi:hypothetical protein